jgi:threonine dehydratase
LPDWLRRKQRSRVKRLVTFQDVEAARKRIAGAIYYSPCPPSIPLSEITGMEIFCKLDNLQRTGSFKERGARNALAQLSHDQQKRGVIAASAGNHAQALAYQGSLLGIPATVVMPKFAPLIKVSTCQQLGANVVLHGTDFGEAKARAHELAKEKGLAYINGYDDPAIIAGQGTMGLEIVEQIPNLEAVIIPVAAPVCSPEFRWRSKLCGRTRKSWRLKQRTSRVFPPHLR